MEKTILLANLAIIEVVKCTRTYLDVCYYKLETDFRYHNAITIKTNTNKHIKQ